MGTPIRFTSNDRLDNAQPGDNTFVITGWISALDPRPTRANAAPPRVYLFRCIINNTTGRQLRVLFWEDMARTYENQLCGQMVTITRARIVPSDPRYPSPLNLIKIEISVQRNSTVTLHGPYVHPDNALIPNIPEILLANVGQYSGEGVIRIVGFIETALEQQIFGNAAYGSGAITDGHYRLVINISVFNLHNVPGVGSHIVVQGTLRRNAYQTLLLQVPDMSNIQIVDDQILGEEELAEGYRIPPGVLAAVQHPNGQAAAETARVTTAPPVISHVNPLPGPVAPMLKPAVQSQIIPEPAAIIPLPGSVTSTPRPAVQAQIIVDPSVINLPAPVAIAGGHVEGGGPQNCSAPSITSSVNPPSVQSMAEFPALHPSAHFLDVSDSVKDNGGNQLARDDAAGRGRRKRRRQSNQLQRNTDPAQLFVAESEDSMEEFPPLSPSGNFAYADDTAQDSGSKQSLRGSGAAHASRKRGRQLGELEEDANTVQSQSPASSLTKGDIIVVDDSDSENSLEESD